MATVESERLDLEQERVTETEASASRLQFMTRALRSRNYRLFFTGQLLSLMGTWMTQVAISWLVYRLTGSAGMLGTVNFVGQVPAFALSPIAGVLLERWPQRRVLIVTQTLAMLQSFALAILTFTGYANVPSLMVLMAAQGFINAFDIPARQSFVVELVDNKADLSNAIALNSSMFNMARVVGPSVGAMIVAAAGEKWCFLLDGISYLAVIAAFVLMRVRPFTKPAVHRNPLYELREGYRYAFHFAPIRTILTLLICMSLMGAPYMLLLPVIAKQHMSGSANTYGLMMTASGLGAVAAALTLAARKSILGLTKVIPYCTLLFGVTLLAFSHSNYLFLALPMLFIMGFAMMQQNAACNTIVQTVVDSNKRGRVMALYTMSLMGMVPFGNLWAGAMANRIGAPNTLLICGAGCLLTGFWFLSNLPVLKEAIRPIYQQLGILPTVANAETSTQARAA